MSVLVPDRCLRALARPGPTTLGGVPEGFAAALVLRLAETQAAPVLFIARDDARLARLSAMLAFFDPDCAQVIVPAWDCLPYDRVSPRADIASRRLAALVRLQEDGAARRKAVLTTVNAAVQRVPPRAMLADATLALEAGKSLDIETLLGYLERNGFVRTGTVMEAGDYAVRGGIVDVFPPNVERPVRLDFFGDVIESMRWFDPLTQRRDEPAGPLALAPVSEVLLTPQSIARFRTAYRRAFGAATGDDPLYEAVSAAAPLPRYRALAAALPRRAGDDLRLRAGRAGPARPSRRGSARRPLRDDCGLLRCARQPAIVRSRRGALSPGGAKSALS